MTLLEEFRAAMLVKNLEISALRDLLRRWLDYRWWQYLFHDCRGWENFWCRAKGHEGPIFYNVAGTEPDWRCQGCGEYLA